MAEYLLSVWHTDGYPEPSSDDMQRMFAQVDAFNSKIVAGGQWVFGGGLHPKETASVVDASGETPQVTDGPFSESKEQMGGFWVIKVDDLDAALALAREASAACEGPVEVRPFQAE